MELSSLVGFVDLHLHLLPGVDDGAQSLDDALAMARALVGLGFTHAAPSPHHRDQHRSRSRQACADALATLREALATHQIPLSLELSAENYFLDEDFLVDVATPGRARVIGASKVLLVEAPYSGPLPSLLDLIFRMKIKGLTPLIAHPERCFEFEKKGRAKDAVGAGALLQLDLGATIGRYGKTAQRLAKQFLDEGLYAVAATDLHGPVGAQGWLEASLKALEQQVGKAGLTTLLSSNPAAVLQGRPLPEE